MNERSARLIRVAPAALRGGAIGVVVWTTAFAFHILPSFFDDGRGLLLSAVMFAVAGAMRWNAVCSAAIAVAAGVMFLVCETTLSEYIADRWVRRDPLPAHPLGAVVALSGSLRPDSTVGGESLDHLLFAIELVRSGRASLFVTTTTEEGFPGPNVVSSLVDQSRIVDMAGERGRWMHTAVTKTTRDEALRAADLLFPRGQRDIGVVTSPMHTRRACATFEAVGFHVTCIASRNRGPGSLPIQQLPRDRVFAFGEWIYELAGMTEYWARGWLTPGGR